MTDEPPAIDFDGVRIRATELEGLLRDAARGVVPVRDVEVAQDPSLWVTPMVLAVAASALRPALAAALANVSRSADPAEVELASEAQRVTKVVDLSVLWDLYFEHLSADRSRSARAVATSLLQASGADPAFRCDPRLRDLVGRADLPQPLRRGVLTLAGRHDRAWLLDHAHLLLGATDADTLRAISSATTGLGSADLARFSDELARRLVALGTPLPEATLVAMAAWIADLRQAEVAGQR